MASRGGQPGNKNGTKNKVWSDAIRKAALQNGALDKAAETLIRLAIEGDVAALKEFGDRMEGKVAQAIVGEDGSASINVIIRRFTAGPDKGD